MKYIILIFIIYNTTVFAQTKDSLINDLSEEIKYKELNHDTVKNIHNIEIGSKKYVLEIYFYSLNDSLLTKSYTHYDEVKNEILESYLIKTHNNQGQIKIKQDNKELFNKIIDKTILKDSIYNNYYKTFTVWDLKFNRIENNKIHLSSFFGSSCGSVGFFVNYMIDINNGLLKVYFPNEIK